MNKQTQEAGDAARSDGEGSAVAASAPAPQAAAEQYFEPAAGGSYSRDPQTGALTKTAGPVPADQPDQE